MFLLRSLLWDEVLFVSSLDLTQSVSLVLKQVSPIAKHAKSKNRMQITEFHAGLSQGKRVLRGIQGM